MARLIWAIICRRVIIDQETNSASYIDAIEGLRASKLPLSLPPLMVGTLWQRQSEGDSVHMRVRILDPDLNLLHSEELAPVTFAPEYKRYRVNVALFGTMVSKEGQYTVVIERCSGREWTEVQRLPLDLELASVEGAPSPVSRPRSR